MTSNPIVPLAFGLLALILLALSWRTLRAMWATHGSVDKLKKRQLIAAQKDELIYAQAAEYYTSLAEGARKTVERLS